MHEQFNAATWLIDRQVEQGHGDATAIRCQGVSYSYADVRHLVTQVAAGLRSRGVRPEERVGVVMLDSVEMVAIILGAMRIGAVPVLTNPLLPGRDLGVIIGDARARIVVVSGERSEVTAEIRAGAPEVSTVITTGNNGSWPEFLRSDNVAADVSTEPYQTWADSPGIWLCTSGTTGMPKLAMHTHGDLRATYETYGRQVLEVDDTDRFYSVGPMFHAYGLGNSLTFPFAAGATSILEPTRPPTPELVADIVTAERPTLFFCIPTFYAALTNAPIADDVFSSVRFGVSAAEALPAETFTRFQERFGVTILDGIGSTELLHIFVSNTPEAHRAGTSGTPVPGYEARIVDADGLDLPAGEPGELLVNGPSASSGYWCRSVVSRATFEGRWTRTGDLYVCSSDGFFTYLGRADDMLRVGGEWVSPTEVEGTLIEHPAVLEAAVVGERDDRDILRPIAHIIAVPGATAAPTELTEWCRARLAGYKRPTRYEIVTELPKTATGKIQRYKLRINEVG